MMEGRKSLQTYIRISDQCEQVHSDAAEQLRRRESFLPSMPPGSSTSQGASNNPNIGGIAHSVPIQKKTLQLEDVKNGQNTNFYRDLKKLKKRLKWQVRSFSKQRERVAPQGQSLADQNILNRALMVGHDLVTQAPTQESQEESWQYHNFEGGSNNNNRPSGRTCGVQSTNGKVLPISAYKYFSLYQQQHPASTTGTGRANSKQRTPLQIQETQNTESEEGKQKHFVFERPQTQNNRRNLIDLIREKNLKQKEFHKKIQDLELLKRQARGSQQPSQQVGQKLGFQLQEQRVLVEKALPQAIEAPVQ